MDDNDINESEMLSSIYLVPVGREKAIKKFVNSLNSFNKYPDTHYICVPMNKPLAHLIEILTTEYGREISVANSVEKAFCLTLSRGYDDDNYMAMVYTSLFVSMMTVQINEECEPEKTICSWIKSRLDQSIGSIPYHKMIKKTLIPVDLVGNNEEILIYGTTIN